MVNDMKVKKYLQVVSLVILVTILFTVAVNAWLAYTLTKEIGIIASTRESYFERGDGSSENPFIIARPIQMYYFAWLQDLGFFNKDDNGEISQVYFKIDYKNDETVFDTIEIDMDGYSIPPIGTPQYPFIGNFDTGITIDIYNKLFYGSNVSAIRCDGEMYQPEWSEEELNQLAKIMKNGISLLSNSLKP